MRWAGKGERRAFAGAITLTSALVAYACGGSGSDNPGVTTPETGTQRDGGPVTESRDSAADPDAFVPDSGTVAGRSMVAVGGAFACALTKDRTVVCWGRNDRGQLGRDPAATPSCGAFPCSPTPTKVEGLPRIAKIALGDDFACALDEGFNVWCWGDNRKGQLEATSETMSFVPKKLVAGVHDVVATASHACALDNDDLLRCWGENTCEIFGKDGSPTRVARIVANIPKLAQVSVGTDAICGVRFDGKILCWGADHKGSLGHDLAPGGPSCGGFPSDSLPKAVQEKSTGLPVGTIADVHIGAGVACARHTNGEVICWGDNSRGALGQGLVDADPHPRAVEVPGISAAQLDLHGHTPCVIIANRVLCWGDSTYGQLESLASNVACGNQSCKALGYPITGMMPARDVASGPGSIAVIKDDLSLWMWGRNTSAETALPASDANSVACAADKCVTQPKLVTGLPALD